MRRIVTTLALAFLIGFVSYRAALVAMPRQGGTACPEGNIPRPIFETVTGLPVGMVISCANSAGEFAMQDGGYEWVYWQRSLLLGLAVIPLAFIALWWFGRRRSAIEAEAGS